MKAGLIHTWTRAAAAKMAMLENFMVKCVCVCVCKVLGRMENMRKSRDGALVCLRLLWQID